MRKSIVILSLTAALLLAGRAGAQTFDFSNIQYWVGSGTNEAAFDLTWNDGVTPDSLVWGYKWNTPVSGPGPTVYDMLHAIDIADTRLLISPHPSFSSPGGYAVFSVYYDLTGLGGTPTIGLPEDLGGPGSENGHAPFAGDHYAEGWFTGFWGELIGIGNPFNGGSWDGNYPDVTGVSFDSISDNGWYALSFSTGETIPNPSSPTAVTAIPEPSQICLLALGGTGLLAWRRRRRV